MKAEFLKSPLNYTGGKYRLLPQIIPLFPKNIGLFVDLFCGGGNVGINIKCGRVLFNDSAKHIIDLYKQWKECSPDSVVKSVQRIIKKFKLSESCKYGYEFYGCESSSGLAKYNRIPFANLKTELNKRKGKKSYSTYLFVAILYAFNNQIRFNSSGDFNLPVGKRDFNDKERTNLINFINRFHEIKCFFSSVDFRNIDISNLEHSDFVYVDPPYLVTNATYNENNQWTSSDERDLLSFLEELNQRGIRFALSNVLKSKGVKNEILLSWLLIHPSFKCHHLVHSYSNSNYQRKDKGSFSDEVLITNY